MAHCRVGAALVPIDVVMAVARPAACHATIVVLRTRALGQCVRMQAATGVRRRVRVCLRPRVCAAPLVCVAVRGLRHVSVRAHTALWQTSMHVRL